MSGPSQSSQPDKTQHSQETASMPPAGCEPTIPASKWPQTHALNRASTGIGTSSQYSRSLRSIIKLHIYTFSILFVITILWKLFLYRGLCTLDRRKITIVIIHCLPIGPKWVGVSASLSHDGEGSFPRKAAFLILVLKAGRWTNSKGLIRRKYFVYLLYELQ